jgi:hypothetical protein
MLNQKFEETLALVRSHLKTHLEAYAKERFDEKHTWASSGPPWSETAERQQQGWDECVAYVMKLLGESR